ncbi:unnamed protein product [Ixodes pacificus]
MELSASVHIEMFTFRTCQTARNKEMIDEIMSIKTACRGHCYRPERLWLQTIGRKKNDEHVGDGQNI